MKLLLAGCEYAGTTTLAHAIDNWMWGKMGARFPLIHDHYKLPHTSGHPDDTTAEEQAQVLALSPKLKEMVQRHSIYYHIQPAGLDAADWLTVGLHIEDGVYGPLYFGYGGDGQPHDRKVVSWQVEKSLLRFAPELILVHVKASPEVIARRMREAPHQAGVLRVGDEAKALHLFEEAVAGSTVSRRIVLDTSATSVAGSVAEFGSKVERFMTDSDRLRVLTHHALKDR